MTAMPESERSSREARNAGAFSPNYVAFFEAFNSGHFFEAHEVLEVLWLKERTNPDGNFFKGLIQVAGAFVHIQKRRIGPAIALLNLARNNLAAYPPIHHSFNVNALLAVLVKCQRNLESGSQGGLREISAPQLVLQVDERCGDGVKGPGCFQSQDVQ